MHKNLLKFLEIVTPYGAWQMLRQGNVPFWQVFIFYLGLLCAIFGLALVEVLPQRGSAVAEFVFVNITMFSLLCGVLDDLVAGQDPRKTAWFKFAMAPFMIASQFMALGWIDLMTGSTKPEHLTILGAQQYVSAEIVPFYVSMGGALLAGYVIRWGALAHSLLAR